MRWDWRPAAGFVAGAVVAWAVGFAVATSALLGLLVAAGVLVLTRLDGTPDPGWERERLDRRHGARGEVQDLAWAMVGRDGRIGERVLRRLREVARRRLARHGLVLDDPAAQRLLGTRAVHTLTRTQSPLPTVADVRHTIDVLDRLGPRRADPTDHPPREEDSPS
ncbi:hypothetical protein [Cellulomonas fengjieae]|uniref:TIGR04222 domain-containing membrane protein n=1 Tax=Cellulomonas fengjieae TaxID=2819978 RepID=A0ABS3SK49_9CELL|nr:hypothetical protein [Cellulomonas fengjieae]MBO3086126.1 hypothetical protein [Cellulomonas fengjieae]QVI65812.1 hypothetical protein KG102_17335 [Cellulomonas fengjieae]